MENNMTWNRGEHITIVKVVSTNFIVDIIEKWRNIFGFNLKGYEKMVAKGIGQIQNELTENYDQVEMNFSFYRYEITQLTNGAVMIVFYGYFTGELTKPLNIYGDTE